MSVDRAAGFIVAVLLGPGVEEVADLPRRVAGAATVHFEDDSYEFLAAPPSVVRLQYWRGYRDRSVEKSREQYTSVISR